MMELSFGELMVLASAGQPKDRSRLAYDANLLAQSTKFDAALALADIKTLEERRFLAKDKTMRLEITREGYGALLQAIPVVENLRAALGMVQYRIVR
jgi:hypothetical protein